MSGAVGSSNTIDFNIATTDSGYSAATGVWTIARPIGVAGDQRERGDHQRRQPAGGKREYSGARRQREAGDRDRWIDRGPQWALDRAARVAGRRARHRELLWCRRFDHCARKRSGRGLLRRHGPDRRDRCAERIRGGDREFVQYDRRGGPGRSQRDLGEQRVRGVCA